MVNQAQIINMEEYRNNHRSITSSSYGNGRRAEQPVSKYLTDGGLPPRNANCEELSSSLQEIALTSLISEETILVRYAIMHGLLRNKLNLNEIIEINQPHHQRPAKKIGEAACKGVVTAIFYSENRIIKNEAKAICSGCSIKETCLNVALEKAESEGIWGGLTAKEREEKIRKTF
jgi:WhiB family redox-sensing transcriptional regulator